MNTIETIRVMYAFDLRSQQRERLAWMLVAVTAPIVAYLAFGDAVHFLADRMVASVGGP